MLIQVDKSPTHIIQKVVDKRSRAMIRYQTVPMVDGKLKTGLDNVLTFDTLAAARKEAGLPDHVPTKKPKKGLRKAA